MTEMYQGSCLCAAVSYELSVTPKLGTLGTPFMPEKLLSTQGNQLIVAVGEN